MSKSIATLFIIYSLLFIHYSFAQGYTSKNPAAIRFYDNATSSFEYRQNDKALEFLESALQKDSTFVEAWLLRGNIYDIQKKYTADDRSLQESHFAQS